MAFAALGDARRAWELTAMINPVNHATSAQAIATYKVEPYVVAADVYARRAAHRPRRMDLVHRLGRLDVPAHRGIAAGPEARGGQAASRSLPARDWQAFKIHYRYRETVYHIAVAQTRAGDEATSGVMSVTVDGVERHDGAIPLVDDHREHSVEVRVHAK